MCKKCHTTYRRKKSVLKFTCHFVAKSRKFCVNVLTVLRHGILLRKAYFDGMLCLKRKYNKFRMYEIDRAKMIQRF